MQNVGTPVTTTLIPKLLLSLRKTITVGMRAAMQSLTMTRIQAICPISMRPAYSGSRRIAPIASASKSEAWETRPKVDETHPKHSKGAAPASNQDNAQTVHAAAFVSHVIGQFAPSQRSPVANATRAYEKADALDRIKVRWLSTSL